MDSHGQLAGSGAAKRRRERRPCQWHRHERLTVQMALCEAVHHAAPQVERGENSAPRGQKTHKAGGRPGALQDPAPQLVAEHAGCPCFRLPSLATPSLADATADAVRLLLERSKRKRKKRRKKKLPRTSSPRSSRPLFFVMLGSTVDTCTCGFGAFSEEFHTYSPSLPVSGSHLVCVCVA